MAKLKTRDELLADLSKANKARKEVLANRAGFSSVEEYKKHLQGSNLLVTEGKPKIHLVSILDASGSMQGDKFDNALKGIYAEVEEFKNSVETDYTFSFIEFSYNTNINTVNFNTPIKEVEKNSKLYARGYTALNQAIGETLEKLLKLNNKEVKTIVSIFTDGEENDSKGKYSSNENTSKIIKQAEEAGITITFIGTERDTKDVIKNLKINASNTLVHENTAKSVEMSFMSKLSATKSYSAKVAAGATQDELLVGFYSKATGKL